MMPSLTKKDTTNAAIETQKRGFTALALPEVTFKIPYVRKPTPMPSVIEYESGITISVARTGKPSTASFHWTSRIASNMR